MQRAMRPTPVTSDLALVLGGGGARGAYQAGLLRYIARQYPHLRIPILVGISAGAINTTHLAAHGGTFEEAVEALVKIWRALVPEDVYRIDARSLLTNVVRSGYGLMSGDKAEDERVRGMVDTAPLRAFLERTLPHEADGSLPGIEHNLNRGSLKAVALSATSYTTGCSITWVEGREIAPWERTQRRSVHTRLTVDHVMASSALPMFFPAEKVGSEWFGDGGIRLTAPLSPALHLGASRILTISTRRERRRSECAEPQIIGYPAPAQVLGVLYNAVFLDVIDQDISRLERINDLVAQIPPGQRGDMRKIEILVLRPSIDLGVLAREYEPRLPRVFRFLTRGLGTRKSSSPSILSVLMFQEDYIRRLVELGESDAERNAARISAFIEGGLWQAAVAP
ncbi:MAG: patatin-like phospholipase family protein, partial [Gemmatimonadaceae bacterium]